MASEETLPNSDFAFDLLKKLKVPYNVRRHSLKVTEKALELAEKIKLREIDMDLIEPERDFLPQTLEEKIICLADKHIAGTKEVSIEQRFEKWFNKYGKTQILTKAKERIEKIQREIEDLT